MILHALARVKNESDVIEEFVRHNLRFVDRLTVIDNGSFDGTLQILEHLRDERLPVAIEHDPSVADQQHEMMTAAARSSARRDDWDWLILLDADEFIHAPSRSDMEAELARVPERWNALLAWQTYVPSAHDDVDEPQVLRRIRHRRAFEAPPAEHKSILSRAFASRGFAISQGNHIVRDVRGNDAKAQVLTTAALAHLPLRSIEQAQRKALLAWGANIARGREHGGWAWQQRRLFEKMESDASWTFDDLCSIALHYLDEEGIHGSELVYDPLPPVDAWRYHELGVSGVTQLATRYVRQLARAVADGPHARPPVTAGRIVEKLVRVLNGKQ